MVRFFCSAVLLCSAGLVQAQLLAASAVPAVAVSDRQLEAVRGGFDAGNGLLLSVGVDRLVSINGVTVASNAVRLDDLSKLTPSQAQAQSLGDVASALTVVRNGPDNVFQPGALGATFGGVVIQNSANDQMIRSQTTINAVVNSGSLLKSLNFGSSLRDALLYAAAPR